MLQCNRKQNLHNAVFLFLQKGSQKADEYVRMIKDRLDVAVEQCIEAAGHEWEPKTQKALLRVSASVSIQSEVLQDYGENECNEFCSV